MTDDVELALPPGVIWRKARDLKVGDKLWLEDGTFQPIAKIEPARWIKTVDGFCLELFASRTDRGGIIAGKEDEFAIAA